MRSPFKFLDAYTLEDKDQFFGRDKEIDELYSLVFKTPLLLVYGLSGTGKTSLVQCGLASKFEGPDWHPLIIRRQETINSSLRETIRQSLPEPMPENLPDTIRLLYRHSLRPIYLIFDQFEELFILGEWEEQQQLAADLKALLESNLPCTVMLVMREKYIGRLYNFERIIPGLFDFRLRVEPMTAQKVKEVLRSSFNQFNISLEPSEEVVLQEIVDNLSSGRSGIQLPYLQVYLDMLYREDYSRTYGHREVEEELPPLTFSSTEIEQFGKIEDVLEKFLLRQGAALQSRLAEKYSGLPRDTVRNILDVFVTEEGTKRPVRCQRDRDSGRIELEEKVVSLIPAIPAGAISDCLELLEQSRLIRFSDDIMELAHDSLAALIDEQRTDEQRQLNEVKRRIQNNFLEFQQTDELLSRKQLNAFEEYLPFLKLDAAVQDFISKSYADAERKEARARARQRRRYLSILFTILAAVGVAFGFWAYEQLQENQELTYDIQISTAESLKNSGRYQEAIAGLNDALKLIDRTKGPLTNKQQRKDTVMGLITRYDNIAGLMQEGDSLSRRDTTLVRALKKYLEAYAIDQADNLEKQDGLILSKIEQTVREIDYKRKVYEDRIENLSKSPVEVGDEIVRPFREIANTLELDETTAEKVGEVLGQTQGEN